MSFGDSESTPVSLLGASTRIDKFPLVWWRNNNLEPSLN